MSFIWLRDLTFLWQACFLRVLHQTLEVLFLLSLRRQNKAHARKIPPALEANSKRVQDSVLSIIFCGLLNRAVELKGECDMT